MTAVIEIFKSKAAISDVSYLSLKDIVKEKASTFGFKYEEIEEPQKIQIKLSASEISFYNMGEYVGLCITACNLNSLCSMKEFVDRRFLDSMPKASQSLIWLDGQKEGDLPRNFRFANVLSSKKLGLHFRRVRLHAKNLEDFCQTLIHFSFVLPKIDDKAPQWPAVDNQGRTVWPNGEKKLHRAVYTIRQVNLVGEWFEVDIFVHQGGRTNQWAMQAQPGDIIGITGPSGRALPPCSAKMLIAGDETAYPAIARLMSILPASSQGTVVLVGNGVIDYVMPSHDNFLIKYVDRTADNEDFMLSLKSIPQIDCDTQVWMASESKEVQALRSHFHNEIGIDKKSSYMSGFWVDQPH